MLPDQRQQRTPPAFPTTTDPLLTQRGVELAAHNTSCGSDEFDQLTVTLTPHTRTLAFTPRRCPRVCRARCTTATSLLHSRAFGAMFSSGGWQEGGDGSSSFTRAGQAESPFSSPTSPSIQPPPCFSMLVTNCCSAYRCPAPHLTYRRAITEYASNEPPAQLPTTGHTLTPHFRPLLFEVPALSSTPYSSCWTAVLPLPITAPLWQAYSSPLFVPQLHGVTLPLDDEAKAAPTTQLFGSAILIGPLEVLTHGIETVVTAVENAMAMTPWVPPPAAVAMSAVPPNGPFPGALVPRSNTTSFHIAPAKPTSSWTSVFCGPETPRSPTVTPQPSPPCHALTPSVTVPDALAISSTCFHLALCRQPSCTLSHSYASLLAAHISGGPRQAYRDSYYLPADSTSFSPVFNTVEYALSSPGEARSRYLLCLPLPCVADIVLRLLGPKGRVKERLWEVTHFSWARLCLERLHDKLESRVWLNWWVAGDWAALDAFVEGVLYLLDMDQWMQITAAELGGLAAHLHSYQRRREVHIQKGLKEDILYCLMKRGYGTPLLSISPSSGTKLPPRRSHTTDLTPRRVKETGPVSPTSFTASASASASTSTASFSAQSINAASTPASSAVASTSMQSQYIDLSDETSSVRSESTASATTPATQVSSPRPSPISVHTPSLTPLIDSAIRAQLQSMRATGAHLPYSSDLDVLDYTKVALPFIRVCNRRVFAAWSVPAELRDEVAYMWDEGMMLSSDIEERWGVNVYVPKRKDGGGKWCNISVWLKRPEGEEDDGHRAQHHALDEPLAALMHRTKRVQELVAATSRPAVTATITATTPTPGRATGEGESAAPRPSPAAVLIQQCEVQATTVRLGTRSGKPVAKRRSEAAGLADYLAAGCRYHAPSPFGSADSRCIL